MIAFQTSVSIERAIDQVFAYVSDPRNLPHWNSAVQAVHPTPQAPNGDGSTYSMERQLPNGRATNEIEILACEPPRTFAIRTTTGPTPFIYRYHFAADNGATVVRLDAQVNLPAPAALLPQLARHGVKKGVDDNLATLKLILEQQRP